MTNNRLKYRGPRRPRRMAREPEQAVEPSGPAALPTRAPSKLDQVEQMLLAEGGTTISDVMAATGWLQHSVRGALAGAIKKRGLVVTSEKVDGVRHYRASRAQ